MRERVFGIETEYAVIYHPARGESERPTNLAIYPRLEAALRRRVPSLPAALSPLRSKGGLFLGNGGSFHYEATAEDYEDGLLEMASPECRDPYTLVEYERAKDELAEELAEDATADLQRSGYRGEVRIGKNNVDSAGHTFGSHESYWVDDRSPWLLRGLFAPVWAALWLVSAPVVAWVVASQLLLLVGLVVAALVVMVSVALLALVRSVRSRRLLRWIEHRVNEIQLHPGNLARYAQWLGAPLYPLLTLHSAVYNRFHFRALRRSLTAHLVTRNLFCGAGATVFDGGPLLRLAQRPPFLRAVSRIFPSGSERPIYEVRDLFFRPWTALARFRRLHLMIGDANLCEWALALRVGTTALVIEAIESREPICWPELADPLEALRELSRDVNLGMRLDLRDGTRASALELQRRILRAVRQALSHDPAPLEIWKARVLRDWEETLDRLESAPESLSDRVDWIAKRELVRAEVPDPRDRAELEREGGRVIADGGARSLADLRLRELAYRVWRLDLRYHELGPRGGERRLERAGRVRRLSKPERVRRARVEPPSDTRAWRRGRAIQWACAQALPGSVAWHRIRVGKLGWQFFRDPLDPGQGSGPDLATGPDPPRERHDGGSGGRPGC
ncbi:MAG: proteasome accessory factor PafA2 family protein [Myxococcota bacterium]